MLEYYMPQASSYAADIDNLVWLVTILVGFWFIAAEGMFFYLIFKYRRKEGVAAEYVTGDEHELKRWIHWPHWLIIFCDIFIIWGAVRVWKDIKQDIPEVVDAEIRIVAQQWAWSFVHPGADGVLDTADDIKTVDELRVENGKTYTYRLEARDVLHDFSVPAFRLKQDAIPGRVITGWFKPILQGRYDIHCAEICGIGHGIMGGYVIVDDAEQHAAWIRENSPTKVASAIGE